MARIPVEKKNGGVSWWPWLLGLLLLAALIWLLVSLFDGGEDDYADLPADTTTTYATPPMDDTGGTITSLATILDDPNPTTLVGRDVRVSGVTASSVTGDSTYWIHNPDEGVDRRVFVVLYELGESESGMGTGADGQYNVDEGEDMTVEGEVMAVDNDDPDVWGVTDADEQELREGQVYIRAHDLSNLGDGQ
ncbi:MAG: hypothetical protein ACOCTG_01460 [Bacteroidota bacterium]